MAEVKGKQRTTNRNSSCVGHVLWEDNYGDDCRHSPSCRTRPRFRRALVSHANKIYLPPARVSTCIYFWVSQNFLAAREHIAALGGSIRGYIRDMSNSTSGTRIIGNTVGAVRHVLMAGITSECRPTFSGSISFPRIWQLFCCSFGNS